MKISIPKGTHTAFTRSASRFNSKWIFVVFIAMGLLGAGCTGLLFKNALPATGAQVPLLIGIGVHIEPNGAVVSELVGGPGPESTTVTNQPRHYHNQAFFERHAEDLTLLADVVERHGGKLTIQAQTPFTTASVLFGSDVLPQLEARGHEIALHFHEDAHLGKNSTSLSVQQWCAVMQQEINLIDETGIRGPIRYWSGGNLYPGVLDAASCAGLDINSDYKNPKTQSTDALVVGVNPWRPAGGPVEGNMTDFAQHDPDGPVVFLPTGEEDPQAFSQKKEIVANEGDQAWFDVLGERLMASLDSVDPNRVNVFHFTVHPGEFRGSINSPFEVIERFLTEKIDPLVAQGRVQWATFSQMADAYEQWETNTPASQTTVSSDTASTCEEAGFITFAVNVHDILHIDESADTLIHLTELFEKYGVKGDFYLTAPMAQYYAEQRPDLVERLKNSEMTLSYHMRPPHPTYSGFDDRLVGLSPVELSQTLLDYETYRLDMTTGDLITDQPGGYAFVKDLFGRAPVVASVPNARWKATGEPIFQALGAKMTIIYHETGTKIDQPFEYTNSGLLIRPSDFSVTRWQTDDAEKDAFWWNMLDTPAAQAYDPTERLKEQLDTWGNERPPLVTVLIHENNFYRRNATPWAFVYYEDRNKTQPNQPPYDLNAPDASRPRTSQNQTQILDAYEALIAYAAANLKVVTSEDIVSLAQQDHPCFMISSSNN